MKALVIGATGATGKYLVDELIKDSNYEAVSIFVRRSTGIRHPKLTEHFVDFSTVEKYASLITGDVLFSCFGTTLKDAGSQKEQWKIEFDIPARFAEIAKENGVSSFVLVSSVGASSKSRFFYPRMKGALEDKIIGLGFKQCVIFRPGMLNRPNTDRPAEKVILGVLRAVNGMGLFKKYRSLPTPLLAGKLAKAPKTLPDGKSVIEQDQIFGF